MTSRITFIVPNGVPELIRSRIDSVHKRIEANRDPTLDTMPGPWVNKSINCSNNTVITNQTVYKRPRSGTYYFIHVDGKRKNIYRACDDSFFCHEILI